MGQQLGFDGEQIDILRRAAELDPRDANIRLQSALALLAGPASRRC